jgi:hypothetical protein
MIFKVKRFDFVLIASILIYEFLIFADCGGPAYEDPCEMDFDFYLVSEIIDNENNFDKKNCQQWKR